MQFKNLKGELLYQLGNIFEEMESWFQQLKVNYAFDVIFNCNNFATLRNALSMHLCLNCVLMSLSCRCLNNLLTTSTQYFKKYSSPVVNEKFC